MLNQRRRAAETVRKLVSYHHERLDGTGYTNGLKGDELTIETRILAVCDAFRRA